MCNTSKYVNIIMTLFKKALQTSILSLCFISQSQSSSTTSSSKKPDFEYQDDIQTRPLQETDLAFLQKLYSSPLASRSIEDGKSYEDTLKESVSRYQKGDPRYCHVIYLKSLSRPVGIVHLEPSKHHPEYLDISINMHPAWDTKTKEFVSQDPDIADAQTKEQLKNAVAKEGYQPIWTRGIGTEILNWFTGPEYMKFLRKNQKSNDYKPIQGIIASANNLWHGEQLQKSGFSLEKEEKDENGNTKYFFVKNF